MLIKQIITDKNLRKSAKSVTSAFNHPFNQSIIHSIPMKTGLGIYKRIRKLYVYYNLLRFTLRKKLIGFDVANQFIQRVDKHSIQLILRKNGASIGRDCDIETGLTFHNCKNYSNLTIGDNCHIGKNGFFDLRDEIVIGNNVVISMQCTFITHIDMSSSPMSKKYPARRGSVLIDDNSYVGSGSQILMGVTIYKNSIIAAKALVNIDVKEGSIVGGIPAKIIKEEWN